MRSKFADKKPEELENIRLQMQDAMAGITVAVALADSIHGKKWIKRLREDLDSIRAKYCGIKGNAEDRLRELSRLQGREDQLRSEVDLLENAASYHKRLVSDMELLAAEMVEASKPEIHR